MDVNYNDVEWHGWNGGECPVHPQTTVEVRCANPMYGGRLEAKAEGFIWDQGKKYVIAFRVVKEYREPSEFWVGSDPGRIRTRCDGVVVNDNPIFHNLDYAKAVGWTLGVDLIHVREGQP